MLLASKLHTSLEDPILDSLNFLNEIIDRFPNAISFAPGAPNLDHLQDIDINQYIQRYIDHLHQERGLSMKKINRMLYQYGPSIGIINDLLATAIYKDKSFFVAPEALVITVGAQEAMLLALRVLFRHSFEQLAVVNPCFVGILGAARLLDLHVLGIHETIDGIDLDELEQTCKMARANNQPIRALYVAPDYSNPSGTILSLEMRYKILELAERHDFMILEDNAYGFTAPPGEAIPTLKALDTKARVLYIGTFAKICLPGARVGYVIADQWVKGSNDREHRLAEDIAKVKSLVTVNTSPINQAIIGGMLLEQGGSFTQLEQQRAVLYRSNLSLLLKELEQMFSQDKMRMTGVTWNRPAGGFFVRVSLSIPADRKLLEWSASQFGILWTPMSPFYLNEGGKNELRLSCSYLNCEQIIEGVRRFGEFCSHI